MLALHDLRAIPRAVWLRLGRHALACAGHQVPEGTTIAVSVETSCGCGLLRYSGAAPPEESASGDLGMPGNVLFYSDLEIRLLNACGEAGWTAAEAIVQAAGESPSAEVRGVLRNLVERGALLSAPGRGYRRAPGAAPPQSAGGAKVM